MNGSFQSPSQIRSAYENGLPGWQFDPDTMDDLMFDRKALPLTEAAPHLAGVGKGKMGLLWRSREKFDPGAFGQESQTTGDCVSHGSRNARDTTRAVEIHIKGEAEEYFKRGATEPTYGARGHGGQGMDPARATRFEADYGFLFRQKYPFADLSQYDSRVGSRWGSSGVPEAVKEACREHNVGQWIAPTTADEVKDLLFSGYALHSGQNFGVKSSSDSRGIAVPGGSWSHDMATVGYDDTREVYPVCVFLVANSWGRWNQPPKVWPEDRYGPWPEGSFWLAEDIYARYFVGSRSIFAYCDIKGVPQKALPDYGNLTDVLG
ncbi:MAG: hypothetical protein GXY58_04785 [Planctomycetaceae bacterium]|nr:hypothetical protein [Planctomycetaceae bacterium]